jgi:hypothetical protein
VAGRIRSSEKYIDLTGNRTRDLPACSIVPEPFTLPRARHVAVAATILFRLDLLLHDPPEMVGKSSFFFIPLFLLYLHLLYCLLQISFPRILATPRWVLPEHDINRLF